jgi:peptidylprolyl isomerase
MLRLLTLCCVAVLLAVAGCGDSDSSSSDKADTTTSAQTTSRAPPEPTLYDNTLPKPKNPGPHPGAKVEQLVIKDLEKGTGEELRAGDTGVFDFIGTIWTTGKPLDASWGKKRPFETVIDKGVVIDGWWQGIPGMRVGGHRTILVPAIMGFTTGTNPSVEGVPLFFDVVLLGVRHAEPPGAGAGGGSA